MKLKDIILDLFGPAPEPDRPDPPRPAPAPPRPRKPQPRSGPARPAAVEPPVAPPAEPPREPAGRSEAGVLAVLRKYGAPYRRVAFTNNRRTMVSVGRDPTLIRMNHAFATAPEPILASVAVLYTPGTRGKKKAEAKDTVQKFINALPLEAAPPRRARPRRVHPGDRVHLERMQAEFDRINQANFGGRLPRVPIHLSRVMKRRNGHFSSHPLEIVISWRLCVHGEDGQAEETMRHEMIHLWQYIEGAPVDHGPAFRRMAHRLDVHPRATRPVKWKPREARSPHEG
ncbi:MAG TPA: SprT-like domain-containing protein [Longimicrobium sp.]|nr:SprT-like domain-containing protein [Longimicrobium sp.]